jgi:hypothetical protein
MENSTDTTNVQPAKPIATVPARSNMLLFLILGIVLILISVCISLFVGFQLGKNSVTIIDNTIGQTVTPTNNNPVATDIPVSVTSATITANMPAGWSLKTYTDGEQPPVNVSGSSLTDNYQGFGALEIKNAANKVVFSMILATGVGGMPTCPEIPQFLDTDPAYIQHIIKIDNETLASPIDYKIIDLTKSAFKEYNLFGLPVRYVGTQLYIELNPNPSYSGFDAACDELKDIVQLQNFPATGPEKVYWVMNGSYEKDTEYEIISNASQEDMAGLDMVLSSIKAN